MKSKLNVMIVGAGKAGTNLALAMNACPTTDIVRIVSRTPGSARGLAELLGNVAWGTDLDEGLADDTVDAVVIATPDRFHAQQALAAARAGKHILCEKPMCNSIAEAEAMIAAAEQYKVSLMVGFCERFNQPCLDARSRIDAGDIGQPVMILARRCHPRAIVRGRAWLNDDETGGVLNYAGTHNIDLICWFMGSPPERVYAEMGQLVLTSQNFTDCAVMTFRFENGAIATLYESFAYPDAYPHGVDRSIEILGTKGCLNLDFMSQPLRLHAGKGLQVGDSTTWPLIEGKLGGAIYNQVEHFASAVLSGRPVLTPGQAGLLAIRIATAARAASQSGQAQTLIPA